MSDSHPAPTWGDVDAFCKADEWDLVGVTDHYHWEKVLPSGETLHTHRSLAVHKVIRPNVFGVILRNQLKVSRDEFWAEIRSGDPVDRPVALDESAPEYPAWVVAGLIRVGIAEAEIREMSPTEAEALLHQKWSETPR